MYVYHHRKPFIEWLHIVTLTIMSLFFCGFAVAESTALFSALPETKKPKRDDRHFTYYPLVVSINKEGITTQDVGGKLDRFGYKLPSNYEPSFAVNNYKAQIEKLGGEIVFECEKEACGDIKALINVVRPEDHISKDLTSMLTAKIQTENKTLFISVYSSRWKNGGGLQLDILEEIPEPLDSVVVNPNYLSEERVPKVFKDMSKKDIKNTSDHPMVKRLPGAYIQKYQQHDFGQSDVMINIDEKKNLIARNLEGRITDIAYRLPRTYSEYEVNANYASALRKLGFTKMFSCVGLKCGKDDKVQRALNSLISVGSDENQFYSLYRLDRPEGAIHAMVYITGFKGGLWVELRVIEETALNDERLVIDLEGLTNKIEQSGHVALDGLLFEFDRDTLLPEAHVVVETLATYLKSKPNRRFYIVGHTDDQGSQAYNQNLAEKRAKRVVNILTEKHTIPAHQLTPKGVGEYSPVGNNLTDEGKKQNRRVELVLRSDEK
ncbi:OmpA family protein [Enterovibrio norvegicus]|uniref:OmpA family protein n=1 Tax=Enterovibrio norvegicus TaxID=188144 RepID=UPI00352C9DB3